MPHRLRACRLLVSRSARRCFISLVALSAAGCSGDYAIGDLSERGLSVDRELQDPERTAGGPDAQLDPLIGSPDVTLTWRAFSGTTAGVGDIDGDGYDDFAVSSIDYANVIAYVHLRYGGPPPVASEDQFALAESGVRLVFEENSPLIESIDAAGDVNGDGFGDMLVTAMVCDPELVPGGGAYLLYGGPERLEGVRRIGDAAIHLELPIQRAGNGACGTPNDSRLGLGDIDGDGLSDFMLIHYQAPDYEDPLQIDEPTQTTAYVFYGREEPLAGGTLWFDADATIVADQYLGVVALGDVTADGRADFALGAELSSYYWVPGAGERLSGEVYAAGAFDTVPCADLTCSVPPVAPAGDVDGDGVEDLLSYEAFNRAHLFYGAQGLLDGGILDLADASATFADDLARPRNALLAPAGDRDGDGDADLLSLFYTDNLEIRTDVTFVSGSSTRLGGPQTLPIQDAIAARPNGAPFPLVFEHQNIMGNRNDRVTFTAIDAGDLNGDGASDLLTSSVVLLDIEETGISYSNDVQQLHIYYGSPGDSTPPVY